MKKSIWLTALARDEGGVQNLMRLFKKYGLEVRGHFWEDDLEKMAWIAPREEILKPEVQAWAILFSPEEIQRESVRYGLALLALTVRAARGAGFPILALVAEEPAAIMEESPTPFKDFEFLKVSDPSLAPKVIARVHASSSGENGRPYRLDVYGNAQIGQWFEVGPAKESWRGALFGVDEGEILFHAVGPSGRLPERAILNYPMQGLTLEWAGRKLTAWAVQNPLEPGESYFVKVKGYPAYVVFGPFPEEDQAELYTMKLK